MHNNKQIKILAIETSCDETAAAVISVHTHETTNSSTKLQNYEFETPVILSNVVSSQVDLHAKTGGVVPEVASRAHIESIIPVIAEALEKANSKFEIQNSKEIQISNSKKDVIARGKIPRLLGTSSAIYQKEIAAPSHKGEWLAMTDREDLSSITHIAVTVGPGLIGSLLVGFNTAKSLAYALGVPIVPVNHIEGHIYSALAQNRITNNQDTRYKQIPNAKSKTSNNNLTIEQLNNELKFPILALTVSGGHTSLTLIRDHGKYENIGATIDDAAGEAFDKVAKLLDLGYPGGPALSRVAEAYREKMTKSDLDVIASHRPAGEARQSIMGSDCFVPRNDKGRTIALPLPLWQDSSYNFSYSGLKTAVLTLLRKAETEFQNNPEELEIYKHELAAVFEEAAVAHLIDKTLKAAKKHGIKSVLLAGGVSANKYLREHLKRELDKIGVDLMMPPMEMTGDNAAMIGLAAYYHILRGDVKNWNEIKVDSNSKL